MDMELCWELFRATGEPMAYMLYRGSIEGEDGGFEEYNLKIGEYLRETKE